MPNVLVDNCVTAYGTPSGSGLTVLASGRSMDGNGSNRVKSPAEVDLDKAYVYRNLPTPLDLTGIDMSGIGLHIPFREIWLWLRTKKRTGRFLKFTLGQGQNRYSWFLFVARPGWCQHRLDLMGMVYRDAVDYVEFRLLDASSETEFYFDEILAVGENMYVDMRLELARLLGVSDFSQAYFLTDYVVDERTVPLMFGPPEVEYSNNRALIGLFGGEKYPVVTIQQIDEEPVRFNRFFDRGVNKSIPIERDGYAAVRSKEAPHRLTYQVDVWANFATDADLLKHFLLTRLDERDRIRVNGREKKVTLDSITAMHQIGESRLFRWAFRYDITAARPLDVMQYARAVPGGDEPVYIDSLIVSSEEVDVERGL